MAITNGNTEGDPGNAVEPTDDEYEWMQQHLHGLAELRLQDEYEEDWEDPTGGLLTEVMAACEEGDASTLQELLPRLEASEQGLNAAGPDGDSPLHIACLYGHLDCIKLILDHGGDPSVVNAEDGTTGLHDAAAGGYLDCMQLLVEKAGAGLLAQQDSDGDTVLHNAARGNHLDIVRFLLAQGADPRAANAAGRTAAEESDEAAVVAVLHEAAQQMPTASTVSQD